MRLDTWIITSYFNPSGLRSRRENFDCFARGVAAQGGRLLVIEMAAGNGEFELNHPAEMTVRVRGNGFIWQKERMLNIALSHLPPECSKVVWADADLIFEADDWLDRTSEALERHVVVQPFDRCIRLPAGHTSFRGEVDGDEISDAFAHLFTREPGARHHSYQDHGHTGFVWAARRDFLDACGLYDGSITGSSDHLMAHAFAGQLDSPCIPRVIGGATAFARHFGAWARKADSLCRGRLGCVAGTVLHLWHGALENRKYRSRNEEFASFDFDPSKDIRLAEDELWAWGAASDAMRRWSETYAQSRDEGSRSQ